MLEETPSGHGPAARGARSERLGIRLDAQTKQLIARAARLEQRKIAEYCVSVLSRAARETIEEHEVLDLTARDRELFFDVLMNPPEPNERLQRAFKAEGLRVAR